MNKKSASEILSFVIILLIVVTSSVVIYNISKEVVYDEIGNLEYIKMKNRLVEMKYIIDDVSRFDGTKISYPITFKVGTLRFQNNRIEYTSSIDVDTTNSRANFCIEDLCYDFSSSKEVMYVEFSDVSITQTSVLTPQTYIFEFIYDGGKNEVRIFAK